MRGWLQLALLVAVIALAVTCIILAIRILVPVRVFVGGPIYPVAEGLKFCFSGRPRPESPIVRVTVHLGEVRDGRMDKVRVKVECYLDGRYRGTLKVVFWDSRGEVVASGSATLEISRMEVKELDIPLSWAEGRSLDDVAWGQVEGEFVEVVLPWW